MKIFIFLIIFTTIIYLTSATTYDDRLKNLQKQITDVKTRVDEILKSCNNATNSTLGNNEISSTFLVNNSTDDLRQNQTSGNNTTFFSNLKGKIQKFFHIKKDSKNNKEAVKIKRCLTRTVGRNGEKFNEQLSGDEELKELLKKFFKCLSLHGVNVANETYTTSAETSLFDSDVNYSTTTAVPEDDEDNTENNFKTEAFLRYLASSKHSVDEIGKPNFRKPDLKKTQEIIDNAKSSIWMTFEDENEVTSTTTTTEEYENVPELPILKRDADGTKKDKRGGLFQGIINSVNDFQYEVPNMPLNLEAKESKIEEPIEEVNRLVQKIDRKQQEDLLKFIDQLNEKPKEFKFNVDKYFDQAYENITKSGTETSEDSSNNASIGARKFFEFDSGSKRKRGTKDQRIEKLKEKFVNQFKDHRHEKYVDFKKIVEHVHDNHADNSFLDKTYRLNDGSIKTSELIKPLHLINEIKSPIEVKLDMELGEKMKEIEDDDFHSVGSERQNSEVQVPFYKTEVDFDDDEQQELSP